ncbi:hypothetical protein Tco_0207570 [Tanacetum coccineum]
MLQKIVSQLTILGYSSTNEVNTANVHVSTGSTPVSTVGTNNSTACLSDAIIYAYLATQPNGSQVVHEDLEQIYEDDLDEMDLKWQLALLSMKKGLASVEEQLVFYKKNESMLCDQIAVLKVMPQLMNQILMLLRNM